MDTNIAGTSRRSHSQFHFRAAMSGLPLGMQYRTCGQLLGAGRQPGGFGQVREAAVHPRIAA